MNKFTGFVLAPLLLLTVSACDQMSDLPPGEQAYRECIRCHTKDQGGRQATGPNLWGIVGRPIGAVEDFRYSRAMQNSSGLWDEATLDAYIANPRQAMPGTSMAYMGMRDAEKRKVLIEYLKTLQEDAAPSP